MKIKMARKKAKKKKKFKITQLNQNGMGLKIVMKKYLKWLHSKLNGKKKMELNLVKEE